MKKSLLATAAFLFQIGAANALQIPTPAIPLAKGGDPHVQIASYDPTQPVLLVSAVGRQVTITFNPTESIKMAVLPSGTSVDNKAPIQPWQGPGADAGGVTALGNVLPLWVMAAGRSNTQIITMTADGQRHVYLFQLIALPPQPDDCLADDCDDPRVATGLSFKYPNVKQQPDQTAARARALVAQRLAAEDRLRTDIFYGTRNWNYEAKGLGVAKADLAPDQMSDNTEVTGLLYLGNREVPSLYIVQADGTTERQVTPTPDKNLLVVYEAVPACPPRVFACIHWRLRKGDEVVDLYNRGPASVGDNPYTGTISPNVIRTTRTIQADAK